MLSADDSVRSIVSTAANGCQSKLLMNGESSIRCTSLRHFWISLAFFCCGRLVPCCGQVQTNRDVAVYRQDFEQATFTTVPGALSTAIVPPATAAFSNFVFRPAGFGSGADAYRYHYEVALADNINGKCLRKLIVPAISGKRDTYDTDRQGTFFQRLARASRHSLHYDSRSRQFNWSGLPSSAFSAALSNLYQPPRQRTLWATTKRTGTNSLGYWFADVAWEFDLTCKARLALKAFHGNCLHPSQR